MRNSLFILTIAALSAATVLGGPIMKNQVSSTANWVVHADYEQFHKSRLGQLIRVELSRLGIEEKLQDFAKVFSFHPLDDVRNVTLYGQGQDREKAVVLIEGRFDKEKLLALVRMNPEHEESGHGNIVIHKWRQEEKVPGNDAEEQMIYGCFYRNDLIVISAGLPAIEHAIDVLNGSAASATGGVVDNAALRSNGAFFQIAANDLGQIAGDQQKAAVLKQADRLALAISGDEKNVYLDVNLRATSQEAAEYVKKILEGIVAYLALAGKEQPNLAALVQKIELSCVQDTVHIHFASAPEPIVQFLREQYKRNLQDKTKS